MYMYNMYMYMSCSTVRHPTAAAQGQPRAAAPMWHMNKNSSGRTLAGTAFTAVCKLPSHGSYSVHGGPVHSNCNNTVLWNNLSRPWDW